ncbi:hypothetical protein N656DRAFT_844851 [Canariomyces notabilis]|uniref:Uncharacterized protein n=1 Tax=Canariomyces notabilis TaxID=2074819 RepID=A0AAN6TE01_9PEZI|nr:hypothetical protein N656DRAFT_844851 [Canariomyces arenarius]
MTIDKMDMDKMDIDIEEGEIIESDLEEDEIVESDLEEGEIVETTSKNDSGSRGAFPYSQPPVPALSCGSLLLQINQIRRQMRRVPKQRRRRRRRGAFHHYGPRPPISPLSCRSLALQIEHIRRQQHRTLERRDDSLGTRGPQPYTANLNGVSEKTDIDMAIPELSDEPANTGENFDTALDEMIQTESGKTDLLLLTPRDSGLVPSCDPFIQELFKGAKEICFKPRTVRPRAWDYSDTPADRSSSPSPTNTHAASLERGQLDSDDTLPVQEVSISWRPGWQSMPLPHLEDE